MLGEIQSLDFFLLCNSQADGHSDHSEISGVSMTPRPTLPSDDGYTEIETIYRGYQVLLLRLRT
jgi:hypothetical protein